jgi:Phosphatidylinositol 3- and 4-kinase
MAKSNKKSKDGDDQPSPNSSANESLESRLFGRSEQPVFFQVNSIRSKRKPSISQEEVCTTKEWRLKVSEEEVTTILTRSTILSIQLVPLGSNYTFLANLCDEETGKNYASIYKPMRGEAPLWDFPSGTLYKREYGAYRVARAWGWHFIPPVVMREGPHGIGTVQLFVDVDESTQYYQFRDKYTTELQRIAVFDMITNNADRKAGHCLLGLDTRIWGIDHGLCFHHVPKMRTVIWDYSGEPLADHIVDDLLEFATDSTRLNNLRGELDEILERREVEIFFRRLEQILEQPYFPSMSSRRQVPWGFF